MESVLGERKKRGGGGEPVLVKAKELKFLFGVGRVHFEDLCKAILGTAPRVRALLSPGRNLAR